MSAESEYEEVSRWFAAKHFALSAARREGDAMWVDLVRLTSGEVIWRQYGRGESEIEARRRARSRFEEEQ